MQKVKESGEDIVEVMTVFILYSASKFAEFVESMPNIEKDMIQGTLPCRIMHAENTCFAFGTVSIDELNLDSYAPNLKNIHIIRNLGMGVNGQCCLGCSNTGKSTCVLKFYHNAIYRTEQAEIECANWTKVYPQAKCRTLKNKMSEMCLVMPYFRAFTMEERFEILSNGDLRKALQTFAASGYMHSNIRWLHVRYRFSNEDRKREIFLIDLGDIEEWESVEEKNHWIKSSLETLQRKAGTEKAKTPEGNVKRARLS